MSTPVVSRLLSHRRGVVGQDVVLGERVQVGRGSRVETRVSLVVGDDVAIGKGCHIEAIGSIGERTLVGNRVRIEGTGLVELEGDNWVGAGATLHAPVRLGRGAVVAPDSVVTGDVPAGTIAAGNPGAVIGARFSDDGLRWAQDERLPA